MDESALQLRLDAIERRQLSILSLLVGGYVFAGAWLLIETIHAVTVWNASFGIIILAILASIVVIYRRRQANS